MRLLSQEGKLEAMMRENLQLHVTNNFQAAGMGNWAQGGAAGSTPASGGAPVMGPAAAPAPSPHLIPNPAEYPCPRCTRQGHTHDKCKSLDKLCRKCNNIGHFTEVQ